MKSNVYNYDITFFPMIHTYRTHIQIACGCICLALLSWGLTRVSAQTNTNTANFTITEDASYIYFQGNGLPNHDTGAFPNPGNPNTISEQEVDFRVTKYPVKNASSSPANVVGIALNGIVFQPGTGETYENDRSWRYEALQDTRDLGLDANNAHVQPTGKYHYHGTPTGLVSLLNTGDDMVHVGYAADGFKMYYSQSGAYDSSYRLKNGTRNGGLGGEYDGTFTQDFEYIAGLGDLDECNAMMHNGEMVYLITNEYPYIARCLWGDADASFGAPGGSEQGGQGGRGGPRGERPPRNEVPVQNEHNHTTDHTHAHDDQHRHEDNSHTHIIPQQAQNYIAYNGSLSAVKTYSDQDQITNTAAVNLLSQRNIMTGNDDGTFAPSRPINRAESIKTLLEALSIDPENTATNPFPDVNASAWYGGYIAKAKQENIVEGYPDGTFRPVETVNQAELLKMLLESFGVPIRSATEGKAWFAPYAKYATETKLIDTLAPDEPMTREAFAEVVYRLIMQQDALLGRQTNNPKNAVTTMAFAGGAFTADEIENFFGGSLTSGVTTVDCTLSGGTKTSCYQFTVAPDATRDHTIGPWCPTNIADADTQGGIWPDGGEINPVSGEFIANLSDFYNDPNWQLFDESTGEINVTDSAVACAAAARPDVDPEYQNHCVECRLEYMDAIPEITYTIPVMPVNAGTPQRISQSGTGVSFNGTRFDASAPTSDILSAYTIAPFDDCGGHVNLHVGYHYHEHTGCSKEIAVTNHEALIGIALDGYGMYRQTDETDLDECQGHYSETEGYHYHIAETGKNEFLGCFTGEYGCASENASSCDASASNQRGGRSAGGPPR